MYEKTPPRGNPETPPPPRGTSGAVRTFVTRDELIRIEALRAAADSVAGYATDTVIVNRAKEFERYIRTGRLEG